MSDTYEITLLDPNRVSFRRSSGGVLTLKSGDTEYPEVLLYRAYPLSNKMQYVSVRTPKGEEIGMIAEMSGLDETSRLEAERELRHRYMIPQVIRIVKIKQLPSMWVWHLETTMGPMKMSMRNLHEHIQVTGEYRLFLADIDRNRVEISDTRALDGQSRKLLSSVL